MGPERDSNIVHDPLGNLRARQQDLTRHSQDLIEELQFLENCPEPWAREAHRICLGRLLEVGDQIFEAVNLEP